MSTGIYHGNPGSFKTASLVQNVIIPALYEGRTVIHNIRGLDDLEKIEEVLGKKLPDSAQMLAIEHDSQAGFDSIATFFHFAPMGALIVIDEGQRVYPKTSRNLDQYNLPDHFVQDLPVPRPHSVPEAFDRHRHFNWDIYISTTNIGKLHPEVRLVAEWAYRLRNLTGLLPWYKNKYRTFRHDPEHSGKSVSHYDGQPTTSQMDQKIFACYKSTATGTAKGSSIQRSLFSDRRFQFLGFVFVTGLITFIYLVGQAVADRSKIINNDTKISVKDIPSLSSVPVNGHSNGVSHKNGFSASNPVEDIFSSEQIYHVGSINKQNLYTVVFKDGRELSLYDFEFKSLGYKIIQIKACFAKLEIGESYRFITCPPHELPKQEEEPKEQQLVQLSPF